MLCRLHCVADIHLFCLCCVIIETFADSFLAHSMSELLQSRGVRLSVRPSVNFAQIATYTTEVAGSLPNLYTMVPRRARIQDDYTKIASFTTNMSRSQPNLLTWACIQGVLKVEVKGQRSRDTDTFLPTRKSLLLPQT